MYPLCVCVYVYVFNYFIFILIIFYFIKKERRKSVSDIRNTETYQLLLSYLNIFLRSWKANTC